MTPPPVPGAGGSVNSSPTPPQTPSPSPQPSVPRRRSKSKSILMPLVIVAAVLLLLVGGGIILVLAGAFGIKKYIEDKSDEKTEEVVEELVSEKIEDVEVTPVDFDYSGATPDYGEDNYDNYDSFDYAPTPTTWFYDCDPGMYRLTATLYDPAKPDKKYKCHIDFRFNGAGDPLSECRYYNDSYGGDLPVNGSYTDDELLFEGKEGSKPFNVKVKWEGGNQFSGTSGYGSKVINADAIINPI